MRTKEDIIPETMSETEFLVRQRDSFSFWNKYVMGLIMEPFIYELCDALQTQNKVVFAGPRYNTKSLLFSTSYPLWKAFNYDSDDPRLQIFLYSSTAELAGKLMEVTEEEYIDENEFLLSLKPKDAQDTWNIREFKFTKGTRLLSKGYGSSTRGPHPKIIIVDDPFGDKLLFPHKFYMDYLKKSLMGMIGEEDDQIFVTGTIFSKEDMIWKLLKDPAWFRRYYPIYMDNERRQKIKEEFDLLINKKIYRQDFDDATKNVLAPRRWPWKKIMQKRRDMITEGNDFAFRQEFLLVPIDDETDALFNYDMIKNPEILLPNENLLESATQNKDMQQIDADGRPIPRHFVISCDPAFSKKGDYCAFVVLETFTNGKAKIVHLFHEKGMMKEEIIDFLKFLISAFPPDAVVVERNSIIPIQQELEALNAPLFFPTMTRETKFKLLLYQLRSRFQNKSLFLPYAEGNTKNLMDTLLKELNSLRFYGNKLQGYRSHDDLAIALAWANNASYMMEPEGTDKFIIR